MWVHPPSQLHKLVQAMGCPKHIYAKHFQILQNSVVFFPALCHQDQVVKFTLQRDTKL